MVRLYRYWRMIHGDHGSVRKPWCQALWVVEALRDAYGAPEGHLERASSGATTPGHTEVHAVLGRHLSSELGVGTLHSLCAVLVTFGW